MDTDAASIASTGGIAGCSGSVMANRNAEVSVRRRAGGSVIIVHAARRKWCYNDRTSGKHHSYTIKQGMVN